MKNQYPTHQKYTLYVPAPGSYHETGLKHGTAIVGPMPDAGTPDKMIFIHYEEPGEISNVQTFEERIRSAAGRLHENYPTSKCSGAYPDQLIAVATICYIQGMSWVIESISQAVELGRWDEGPHHIGGSPERYVDRISQQFMRKLDSHG